jgi:hypothetical protein
MKFPRLTALLLSSTGLLWFSSCEDVLDKQDLGTASEEVVFQNETLANLNLNFIYEQNLPAWFGQSTIGFGAINPSILSEETSGESLYFEGTVQPNTVTDIGTGLAANNNYGKIRTINTFIRAVNRAPFDDEAKNRLRAQAHFFRAWRYFDLVRLYGGVPLVLSPLNGVGQDARDAAYLPRNTTTETFNQIVADLDSAITFLPGNWPNNADWGHVTSGTAAAFKARVLLYAASPQFTNSIDDPAKWQRAFAASQQARTILTTNGYRLHPSFDDLWFKEGFANNKEAVFVTGYNTSQGAQASKNNQYDNGTRPAINGTGGGANQPTWDLVKAFPMLDGKKPGESTKYSYSDQFFYKNRDPRFDKTIAYNGASWPLNGNANYKLWTYLRGTTTVETPRGTNSGFYTRKAIDPNVPASLAQYVGTDWIEIRYAEVLLNLAEAACGVNNLTEAYTQLKAIRQRAGIEPGNDQLYGLQASMTRAQMFDAILYERQIEFAFEGKRFWDLRRWKKLESLNGKRRQGITITLKTTGVPADFAATRDNVNLDVAYRDYFTITTKNLDTRYAINWRPQYYFFAIPQPTIDNNPLLIQNNGFWGGTFDPLQ